LTILGNNGGTIIVEQGVYTIGNGDKAMIPSNTTLIGRGNVVIEITDADTSAFSASNHYSNDSNERIMISGFRIIVKPTSGDYINHPIFLMNVSDCIVEKVYVTAVDNQETSNTIGVETNGSTAILLHGTVDNKCINNNILQ